MSVNDVKLLPLNVAFLKLQSCKISFSSELSNLLCKVSGRKNTHFWPSWRVYFSRSTSPFFPHNGRCGLFKNLLFSCRRYFKVPLLILLAASPLACRFRRRQNFIAGALTKPPATQANSLHMILCWFYLREKKYTSSANLYSGRPESKCLVSALFASTVNLQ